MWLLLLLLLVSGTAVSTSAAPAAPAEWLCPAANMSTPCVLNALGAPTGVAWEYACANGGAVLCTIGTQVDPYVRAGTARCVCTHAVFGTQSFRARRAFVDLASPVVSGVQFTADARVGWVHVYTSAGAHQRLSMNIVGNVSIARVAADAASRSVAWQYAYEARASGDIHVDPYASERADVATRSVAPSDTMLDVAPTYDDAAAAAAAAAAPTAWHVTPSSPSEYDALVSDAATQAYALILRLTNASAPLDGLARLHTLYRARAPQRRLVVHVASPERWNASTLGAPEAAHVLAQWRAAGARVLFSAHRVECPSAERDATLRAHAYFEDLTPEVSTPVPGGLELHCRATQLATHRVASPLLTYVARIDDVLDTSYRALMRNMARVFVYDWHIGAGGAGTGAARVSLYVGDDDAVDTDYAADDGSGARALVLTSRDDAVDDAVNSTDAGGRSAMTADRLPVDVDADMATWARAFVCVPRAQPAYEHDLGYVQPHRAVWATLDAPRLEVWYMRCDALATTASQLVFRVHHTYRLASAQRGVDGASVACVRVDSVEASSSSTTPFATVVCSCAADDAGDLLIFLRFEPRRDANASSDDAFAFARDDLAGGGAGAVVLVDSPSEPSSSCDLPWTGDACTIMRRSPVVTARGLTRALTDRPRVVLLQTVDASLTHVEWRAWAHNDTRLVALVARVPLNTTGARGWTRLTLDVSVGSVVGVGVAFRTVVGDRSLDARDPWSAVRRLHYTYVRNGTAQHVLDANVERVDCDTDAVCRTVLDAPMGADAGYQQRVRTRAAADTRALRATVRARTRIGIAWPLEDARDDLSPASLARLRAYGISRVEMSTTTRDTIVTALDAGTHAWLLIGMADAEWQARARLHASLLEAYARDMQVWTRRDNGDTREFARDVRLMHGVITRNDALARAVCVAGDARVRWRAGAGAGDDTSPPSCVERETTAWVRGTNVSVAAFRTPSGSSVTAYGYDVDDGGGYRNSSLLVQWLPHWATRGAPSTWTALPAVLRWAEERANLSVVAALDGARLDVYVASDDAYVLRVWDADGDAHAPPRAPAYVCINAGRRNRTVYVPLRDAYVDDAHADAMSLRAAWPISTADAQRASAANVSLAAYALGAHFRVLAAAPAWPFADADAPIGALEVPGETVLVYVPDAYSTAGQTESLVRLTSTARVMTRAARVALPGDVVDVVGSSSSGAVGAGSTGVGSSSTTDTSSSSSSSSSSASASPTSSSSSSSSSGASVHATASTTTPRDVSSTASNMLDASSTAEPPPPPPPPDYAAILAAGAHPRTYEPATSTSQSVVSLGFAMMAAFVCVW
jgi:hypothetical protein